MNKVHVSQCCQRFFTTYMMNSDSFAHISILLIVGNIHEFCKQFFVNLGSSSPDSDLRLTENPFNPHFIAYVKEFAFAFINIYNPEGAKPKCHKDRRKNKIALCFGIYYMLHLINTFGLVKIMKENKQEPSPVRMENKKQQKNSSRPTNPWCQQLQQRELFLEKMMRKENL